MNASALGALDAIKAEQVDMSIRLRSDGLTFALLEPGVSDRCPSEQSGQSLAFPRGHASLESAMEQAIYLHPELALPYREVHILYTPLCSMLVPADLFAEEEAGDWLGAVVGNSLGGEEYVALSHPLSGEDKVLLSAIPRGLYSYLRRTYLKPELTPYYLPILETYQRQSREQAGERLCVILRLEGMDCMALRQGELRLINSFSWTRPTDEGAMLDELLFYVFSLWRGLSLEATRDQLVLLSTASAHPLGRLAQEAQERLVAHIGQIQTEHYHYI